MVTKLQAAKIAMAAGCRMAIADGRAPNPLKQLAAGARCTWFLPSASPPAARKRWIAGLLNPVGAVTVDSGAEEALMHGRSLLPAGVEIGRGAWRGSVGKGVSLQGGAGTLQKKN